MDTSEKILGSQRLVCKNPECGYLLKKIYFLEGWEKKSNGNNGVSLVKNNGSSYYECPQCKAKNYIVQQGEKIILEKIVRYEMSNYNDVKGAPHGLIVTQHK
jgi:Zn finger protein HypA/HybF involved in hydrogenase expression